MLGDWALKQLVVATEHSSFTPSTAIHADNSDSLSGVEMESPHIQLTNDKECSHEIPEIGVIATSWVGHTGRQQLIEDFTKSIVTPKVQDLKKELLMVASVCLKGFQSIETDDDLPSDAQKAIDLCQQYVPKPKQRRIEASVSELWKENCNVVSQDAIPVDKVQLATTVLGEKIVGTITEKHKDPPHVSLYGVFLFYSS